MSLNSGLQEVSKVFFQTIFRIPDYQRGYSWQLKQLNEFWEDLINIQMGKKHYIGVLTLENIPKNICLRNEKWNRDRWLLDRSYDAYYIVDGQQRITTIIILISLILDAVKGEKIDFRRKDVIENQYISISSDESKSYLFGYELDDPSDNFFRAHILGQDDIPSKLNESLYTKNILYAKRFFQKKINELITNKGENEVVNLFMKITNDLVFNVYVIDNEIDVSVAFETMNNRGITLSKLELLKNRLMYLTTILGDGINEKNLRIEINNCWREVYKFLGKRINLKDDVFLKDHWIMYFGNYNRTEQEAFSTFLLEKYFVLKNFNKNNESENTGLEIIHKYVQSIEKNIFNWFTIFYPEYKYSKFSEEIKEWMLKLKDLGRGAFTPLIMAALSVGINNDSIVKLLQSMERYVFLVFKVSQRRADAGNSKFYQYSYELLNKKIDVQDIIQAIDQLVFAKSGMYYYGFFDIDKFRNYIKDRYLNAYDDKIGYLGWSKIKYFLCEYELFTRKENSNEINVDMQTLDKNTEVILISQICPLKTRENNKFSKQQMNYIKYSLGNILLSNTGFSKNEKLELYTEIEVRDFKDEWTPEAILERGIKMFEFFEKRWDVQIGNRDFIKELLFLDFIK